MLTKMKNTRAERSDRGFTIIEVMIVLAIAGLILLIVFLAVPALQRSSRNSQRKSDVGRIGSAATTIVSDNNGNMTSLTAAAIKTEVGNLSFYQFGSGSTLTVNDEVSGGTHGAMANVNNVDVEADAECVTGSNTAQYAARHIAVLYAVESGNAGHISVCVDQ